MASPLTGVGGGAVVAVVGTSGRRYELGPELEAPELEDEDDEEEPPADGGSPAEGLLGAPSWSLPPDDQTVTHSNS